MITPEGLMRIICWLVMAFFETGQINLKSWGLLGFVSFSRVAEIKSLDLRGLLERGERGRGPEDVDDPSVMARRVEEEEEEEKLRVSGVLKGIQGEIFLSCWTLSSWGVVSKSFFFFSCSSLVRDMFFSWLAAEKFLLKPSVDSVKLSRARFSSSSSLLISNCCCLN